MTTTQNLSVFKHVSIFVWMCLKLINQRALLFLEFLISFICALSLHLLHPPFFFEVSILLKN
jgi:hypothetical protein